MHPEVKKVATFWSVDPFTSNLHIAALKQSTPRFLQGVTIPECQRRAMWEQLVWCVYVCVCSKHLTWRVSWSERILHISTCIHLNLLQGSILCICPISSHTCSHTFYHSVIYCYILLYIVIYCYDPIRFYQILSEIPRISIMDIPRKDRKVSFFPMGFSHGFSHVAIHNLWVTPTFRGAGRRIRPSGAHGQGAEGPADGWPIQANLKSVDMQRSDIITSILCVYSICIICILIIIPHCV